MFEMLVAPLVGVIGSVATAYQNYKMQQLAIEAEKNKQAHELAMLGMQKDLLIAETEANIQIVRQQVDGMIELEAAKAFTTSQADMMRPKLGTGVIESMIARGGVPGVIGNFLAFLLGICDVLTAVMRPFLTAYVVLLATWTTYQAYLILERSNGAMSVSDASETWHMAVQFIYTLVMTLVPWWFGSSKLSNFAVDVVKKK